MSPFLHQHTRLLRAVVMGNVGLAFIFVANNFLLLVLDWPKMLPALGLTGQAEPVAGLFQLASYIAVIIAAFAYAYGPQGSLGDDARKLAATVSYLVRAAFLSVLLIGLVDMALSFMRVQGLHALLFSETIASMLGQPQWRGIFIHLPIMALAALIAVRKQRFSFIWLSLMVVLAEFAIVITRFLFSYEQTFMGDLVRFWYAALFLFASAQTLAEDGHVRVDILYANFSEKHKALVNAIGSALLGVPLCWVILASGLASRASLINNPIISFETAMSGFGMYVKYLMAAFLLVFAVTMLVQFSSYFLGSMNQFLETEKD